MTATTEPDYDTATRGTNPDGSAGIPVPGADLGVCYLNPTTGQGTTQWGFLPCDASFDGPIMWEATEQAPATATVAVAAPPVPPQSLPATGGELGVAAVALLAVAVGAALRRVARA